MKKVVFACLVCLAIACTKANAQKEVKFKNPIFYNKMIPERGGADLLLTPTWAKYDMLEDGIAEGPCELLANEESYIIITCTIHYPNGDTRIYKNKYELLYDCSTIENTIQYSPDDGICFVQVYDYDDKTNQTDSWMPYTVQKPLVQKTK